MVKIKYPHCKKGYYFMNIALHSNLQLIKEKIREDLDMVIAVDGTEGAGKSTVAQQIAYLLDPTFNIERLAFDANGFKKAILKAGKYQAVIYDESFSGLNARQSMGQTNRSIVSMLTEIRQKNLFVLILIPSFFDLDKYVALWRSRALIHVYMEKNFKRGFFSFYNTAKKKKLYVLGKKLYQYNCVTPNFRGNFPNQYTVDEKEYRKRKWKKLGESEQKLEKAMRYLRQRNSLALGMYKKFKTTFQEMGEFMGIENQDDAVGSATVRLALKELHKRLKDKEAFRKRMLEFEIGREEEKQKD